MLSELLKPAVEYLKGQPFNNVMIAVLLGVIVYFNIERNAQTDKAHSMVRTVISEIRKEGQDNQNRLIFAMKGVHYAAAGEPEKAEAVFDKLEETGSKEPQ